MKTAASVFLVVLTAIAVLCALAPLFFLTEYPQAGVLAVVAVLAVLAVVAAIGHRLWSPQCTRTDRAAFVVFASTIVAMLISGMASATISYARFGLTIVGALPLPAIDLTISSRGLAFPRDKSHRIRAAEIDALLAGGADLVVVGIGWDSLAQLEAEMSPEVRSKTILLPTPEAIRRFQQMRAAGEAVALLLHTTC